MDKFEAIKLLKEGRKIKHSSWENKRFLHKCNNEILDQDGKVVLQINNENSIENYWDFQYPSSKYNDNWGIFYGSLTDSGAGKVSSSSMGFNFKVDDPSIKTFEEMVNYAMDSGLYHELCKEKESEEGYEELAKARTISNCMDNMGQIKGILSSIDPDNEQLIDRWLDTYNSNKHMLHNLQEKKVCTSIY